MFALGFGKNASQDPQVQNLLICQLNSLHPKDATAPHLSSHQMFLHIHAQFVHTNMITAPPPPHPKSHESVQENITVQRPAIFFSLYFASILTPPPTFHAVGPNRVRTCGSTTNKVSMIW